MSAALTITVEPDDDGGYRAVWGAHSAHGETPERALAEMGYVFTMVCEEHADQGVSLSAWLLSPLHPAT